MTSLPGPPLVVGTVRPDGLAALVGVLPADRAADVVEARFDLAGAAGAEVPDLTPFFYVAGRLAAAGWPVMATIRLVADGGRCRLDGERLPWFTEALAFAAWVDIEVDSAIAAEVVGRAHARGRLAIVSHHDFTRTPEHAELDQVIRRARALGADVVKIATLVDGLEDHDRLVDLLRRHRTEPGAGLAVIGMGPEGTSLRSYLPCVGSRLTYGYLDNSAAPGQIPARALRDRLIADCPHYAEYRRRDLAR